jgi:AcrR family transcriptional regulator
VAQACLDLLAAGHVDIGPAEVAERAGVSRATVYRWWPTRTELLEEALTLHNSRLDTPNTGNWPDDVRALAADMAKFFSNPIELSLNTIMVSGKHPEFDAVLLAQFQPAIARWRSVIDRAIARDEVARTIAPDTIVRMLTSPFLVITLVLHRRPTIDEIRDVANFVIAATHVQA